MPLLTNLVSYWDLDEASGNAIDAHGSNDLTDNNTVGAAAGVRDFEDGNSEYFSHADNADLSIGDIDFTLSMKVRLESNASPMYPLSKSVDVGDEADYAIRFDADNFYFFVFVDGTWASRTSIQNTTAISTGVDYFVVVWHDATANEIGMQINNGTPATTAHSGGVFNGSGNFYIGRSDGTNGYYWDGYISKVGLWKGRVLTSGDITELYDGGAVLAYSELGGGAAALPRHRRVLQAVNRASTY